MKLININFYLQVQDAIQAAFWSSKSYSLHTGYLWSKIECYGFTSISTSTNHAAPAVHAALKPIFDWCLENRISQLIMVSDSTWAQYRNCNNVFLLHLLAKEHKLQITWIFTEVGHGKVCR